jgi:excisionase family DNA binding protein
MAIEKYLTLTQCAEILGGCSVVTVRRLIKKYKITVAKPTGTPLIKESDLKKILAQNPAA